MAATKRWLIDIGRPDGKAGDQLRIQAATEAEARAQAGDDQMLLDNPGWEILAVYGQES